MRLLGLVVDELGAGVGGATVWRTNRRIDDDLVAPPPIVTDADGRFAFDDLEPRSYELEARDGMRTANTTIMMRESRPPVVLRLERRTDVRFRVTADGKPLAGAIVRHGAIDVVTDADGIAITHGWPARFHAVRVIAEGYATQMVSSSLALDPGTIVDREITLDEGVTVTGIVLDAAGAPLVGAVVSVGGDDARIVTDERGRWVAAHVAGGPTYLSVDHEHRASATHVFEATASRDDIVVRLDRGARIEGVVVERDGSPVARALVMSDPGVAMFLVTDVAGRFATSVRAGVANIAAHRGTLASPVQRVNLEDGQCYELRLVVEPAEISGTVIDSTGAPVVGADVIHGPFYSDQTDATGSFSLGGMPFESCTVEIVRVSRDRLCKRITSDVRANVPAHIVVPASARLTARVMFRGAPVAHFGVKLSKSVTFPYMDPSPTGVRSPDGRFTIDDVVAGTWGLIVGAEGTSLRVIENIEIAAGATVDLGDIELLPGRTVRGVVRTRDGKPVAKAQVNLGSLRDGMQPLARWFYGAFERTTDDEGAYTFDGVPDNARDSVIRAHEPSIGSSITLRIRPGDVVADLEIGPTG